MRKRLPRLLFVITLYLIPVACVLLQTPIWPFYHYPMYSNATKKFADHALSLHMLSAVNEKTGTERLIFPPLLGARELSVYRIDLLAGRNHRCETSAPCASDFLRRLRADLGSQLDPSETLRLSHKVWSLEGRPAAERPLSSTLEGEAR